MRLWNPRADVFVPDGEELNAALARTTDLCVGAHQDDIEIMAYHGIARCFGRQDRWFTGVVASDGAGSPRAGVYGKFTDDEMQRVRLKEQRLAAAIGGYACQVQLGYSTTQIKDSNLSSPAEDLLTVFQAAKPQTVYLHNLADKHDTHLAVSLLALAALRRLSPPDRPKKVYGCEVWRDLDWLPDESKQCLPVSERPNLAAALVSVFDSQVSGGKRYDLATAGRRLANATYFAAHATDEETALTFAMDLTPLLETSTPVTPYVTGFIDRFKSDVESRLARLARE